jgi:hypothetical protein
MLFILCGPAMSWSLHNGSRIFLGTLLYNKEKVSNAFFGTNGNKSVYLFVYGFRLTFAVFMDGDLPNSFSAASFIGEQTIILDIAGPHRIINKRKLDIKKITTAYWSQKNVRSLPTK